MTGSPIRLVDVCVDRPLLSLDRPFTYRVPAGFEVGVGTLVTVPFHGKRTRGWVLGPAADIPSRVLEIVAVNTTVRFFDEELLGLYRWMSERYVAPLAAVIARSHPPRVVAEERARSDEDLEVAPDDGSGHDALRTLAQPETLAAYRGGREFVHALTHGRGAFVVRPAPRDEATLTVEAVAQCIAGGRRAIVVVPEADPVPATARAIFDTFGSRARSLLGGDRRSRYRRWLEIGRGGVDVVVGTRPAVFAPVRDLGLIWIARESHPAHREERAPYYHARDVALERGRRSRAVVALSAFCPSVEAAEAVPARVTAARRGWAPVEVVSPGPEGRAPRLVSALREAKDAFLFEPLQGAGVAHVCRACSEPAACAVCGGTIRVSRAGAACLVCEAEGRCASCGASDFGVRRGGAERVGEWAARLTSVPVRTGVPEPGVIAIGGPEAIKDEGPLLLDLVAVLHADGSLRRPGLTAAQRALTLWMEAASWARGRIVIQTRAPADPAVQSLVAGNPERFHLAEMRRRADAGFPVNHPVFRVAGGSELQGVLAELQPETLLATEAEGGSVCLLTIRPEDLPRFSSVARELAARGVIVRIEADPHL